MFLINVKCYFNKMLFIQTVTVYGFSESTTVKRKFYILVLKIKQKLFYRFFLFSCILPLLPIFSLSFRLDNEMNPDFPVSRLSQFYLLLPVRCGVSATAWQLNGCLTAVLIDIFT